MSTYPISAPDWCFYRGQCAPEAYYAGLRNAGVTGVEMVAPERWAAARAAGLRILNLAGPGMTRGLNRVAHHAELLPQLRASIDTAHAAGIPGVIVFSGNREGLADAEGIAACAEGLAALAPYAEAAGVTLLFEMLNSQEHADYQADSAAYGFAVTAAVGSPAVRVLYDIYHMGRMGEDVRADLLAHLPLVGHIHLAETPGRTMPLAEGHVRHAEIVPAVLDAGYQGAWGLEFRPEGDALTEIAESVAMLSALAMSPKSPPAR